MRSVDVFGLKAGYSTAHYGKWHLANDMIPDAPFLTEYGYDDYGSYNCSGPQMFVHDDVKSAIPFMKKNHAKKDKHKREQFTTNFL